MKDFNIFSELFKTAKDKDLKNVCIDCVPAETPKPKKWTVKLCKKCGKHNFCY